MGKNEKKAVLSLKMKMFIVKMEKYVLKSSYFPILTISPIKFHIKILILKKIFILISGFFIEMQIFSPNIPFFSQYRECSHI